MRVIVVALLLSFAGNARAQTAGNAQAGKALWDDNQSTQCRNCHGINGEGAFGPDLAGRKLTAAQFTKAVRTPWGVMPAFVESQVSDTDVANFLAYFNSLPTVTQPGPWRFPLPAGAPHGQEILLATAGCGQCHGPIFATPRMDIGGMGASADFEWFKQMVYDHPASMPGHWKMFDEEGTPRVRMGTFSKARLPESVLRELWTYVNDLGPRAKVESRLSRGVPGANGVTYTLTVENAGLAGKGLAAEDLTIALALPAGSSVVSTTGAGYQGVRPDAEAKANVAVWQLPKLTAREEQDYTITLSRAATSADNLRGTIRWTKPAVKPAPDSAIIAPAPTTPAPAQAGGTPPPDPTREVIASGIPGVIAAGTKIQFIRAGFDGTEGVVSMPDGSVLFCEQNVNKIIRIDLDGKFSTYLEDTNRTIGLAYDRKGRLIGAQSREPRIGVLSPTRTTLADAFEGQPLVRPNDLVIDKKGGIYFTDPLPNPGTGFREPPAGRKPLLFYITPAGTLTKVTEIAAPNGVQLSPDEKTLYAVDGNHIVAFDVQKDGSLTKPRRFAETSGDGMMVDAEGRLYAAVNATVNTGIQVISPQGQLLGLIPSPVRIQSFTFAGKDRKTIYAVGTGAIYRIPMLAAGIKGRAK